ncbi:MAG: hypothetical protein ACYCS4_14005 [Acidimicrobiales bacterium]
MEREREIRHQVTDAMSPEVVAEVDQARVDFLTERAVELSERRLAARPLSVSGPGNGRSVLEPDFDDPNMEFDDLSRGYGPGIEF